MQCSRESLGSFPRCRREAQQHNLHVEAARQPRRREKNAMYHERPNLLKPRRPPAERRRPTSHFSKERLVDQAIGLCTVDQLLRDPIC